MKVVDKYESNDVVFFTIQLDEDVFVDVKVIGDLCYVMQCEDGRMAYNSKECSLDFAVDEKAVIALVKSCDR